MTPVPKLSVRPAGLRQAMRASPSLLLQFSLGLCCAAAAAVAHGAALQDDARSWFLRMQNAALTANFHGTLVSSVAGTMTSSRVVHYSVGEHTYETLEALDGHQQRTLRHNDAVHTLWPQTKVAVVEKRETLGAWATTPQALDPLALDLYDMRREGQARLAGRDAVVFALEPRDLLRYPQRLWADRDSGLLLRADVLSSALPRTVLESTAFSSVEIGVKPQPEAVQQALQRLDGYRVLRPQQRRTSLDAEGWTMPRPVPGFKLAGCVQRGMERAGGNEPVLQAVFTDGLTHVSLFIESFKPALHRTESQVQQGAMASLTQRSSDHWFTVVGDVPTATLRRFVSAVERRVP